MERSIKRPDSLATVKPESFLKIVNPIPVNPNTKKPMFNHIRHTIHSISHPVKTNFLDQVYAHVDHYDIDALVTEYVLEGEHQDGQGYWDNFANALEVIEDFKRFVEFADECSWAYEE